LQAPRRRGKDFEKRGKDTTADARYAVRRSGRRERKIPPRFLDSALSPKDKTGAGPRMGRKERFADKGGPVGGKKRQKKNPLGRNGEGKKLSRRLVERVKKKKVAEARGSHARKGSVAIAEGESPKETSISMVLRTQGLARNRAEGDRGERNPKRYEKWTQKRLISNSPERLE